MVANWRLMRTGSMIALGVGTAILWGFGGALGIENISEEVMFLPITWSQAIGAGMLYSLYVMKNITRA